MPKTVGYPEKLTKRPPRKVRDALDRARILIEEGKDYRDTKRHRVWRQSDKQYEGKHWEQTDYQDVNADLVTVNMSFSTVNTIVPYITGSSPSFLVEPWSKDATPRTAKAQEAFLNRLWSSQDVDGQSVLTDVAVDALIYGDGYVKVGYNIDTRRVGIDDEQDVASIWVKRISPWDVWIDPHANGIRDARWVAHRMRVSRREIEEDRRYANTHEENLHTVTLRDDDDRPDVQSLSHDEQMDLVEVIDFYDLVDRTVLTFGEGDLPFRFIEEIGSIPIVQMTNYRIPGSPYHMGELEQLWGLQQELNKTRSEMATHRRRNVSKFVARRSAFDQDALDALKSPIVNDVAFVDTAEDLDALIRPLNLPALTGDTYAMSDQINRDIYEISGVNEYLRGATPAIRRTATEATIIEGASNVKTADKLRMVEKAARSVGRLILDIAEDVFPVTDYDEVGLYLTGRQAEQLNRAEVQGQADEFAAGGDIGSAEETLADTDNIYADAILTPSPEMWVGTYEVIVEQASTELRSPQMREQKFRNILETTAGLFPILQQQGVQVNFKRLLELWLEAAGIEDIDAVFDGSGQLDPMMQQMMAQGGMPPMGGNPQEGEAMPMNAAPPEELLTAMNTGAMPPVS